MSKRVANPQLAALLGQTGWSGQRLANAVNAAGTENGLTLRYDRTSVAHWLSGSCPPPVVSALVAEALSRRLGRAVKPGDTGLVETTDARRHWDIDGDVVAHLVRLGAACTAHGAALREAIYSAGPLDVPDMVELVTTAQPPRARGRERVGTAHVTAATLMLSLLSRSDLAFGSGEVLPALAAYLATDVASWLRASAAPAARTRLYSAAARLTYLAGWMCFDQNLHGAGQRTYQAAARLAAVGGDTFCYAAALRSLSVQAHYLGHHPHARSLAEVAMREADHVPLLEGAFLAGQLAVAEAACGRHDAARTHLTRAERMLDQATEGDTAVGDYHLAALLHQHAETLASANDRRAAIRALTTSLRHRPKGELRAHAITTARLAELYLDIGHLDHACAAWTALLDDRPQLSSGRVERAVRSMCARLRPHSRYPPALALIKRARQPTGRDEEPPEGGAV